MTELSGETARDRVYVAGSVKRVTSRPVIAFQRRMVCSPSRLTQKRPSGVVSNARIQA